MDISLLIYRFRILRFKVQTLNNDIWDLTLSAVTDYSISTRFTSSTPLTALINSMMEDSSPTE